MDEQEWLAERFENHRNHLRGVAYRMLGSLSEAEDAVQEAWLRLSRNGTSGVENLGGWLTTIVARTCLDVLRSRKSRREEPLGAHAHELASLREDAIGPEAELELADSVGLALLVVLDTLAPAERLAFVMHDIFDLPFDEIAPMVGRSPAAARQLASRARRRVQGKPRIPEADVIRQRRVVEAFLSASRNGDFKALLEVLDLNVVLRADRAAVPTGKPAEFRGAAVVATQALSYSERSRFTQIALVEGLVGAVVAPHGRLFLVLAFTIRADKIVEIDVIADPARLRRLDVAVVES